MQSFLYRKKKYILKIFKKKKIVINKLSKKEDIKDNIKDTFFKKELNKKSFNRDF